jgi:hypothetical protein
VVAMVDEDLTGSVNTRRAEPDLFYGEYEDVPQCIRDRASKLPPPPYL